MELPTYTNIWKIEKRLYKLYDFRLPMPLPVGQIAAFLAIEVPYTIILTTAGMPFSHTWLWLYLLPPGVLAWLVTRPVLEGKRLPELVTSQLRYLTEPRTWCRMAPLAEQDDIVLTARIWRSAHYAPPASQTPVRAVAPRPAQARGSVAVAGQAKPAGPAAKRVAAPGRSSRLQPEPRPVSASRAGAGAPQPGWPASEAVPVRARGAAAAAVRPVWPTTGPAQKVIPVPPSSPAQPPVPPAAEAAAMPAVPPPASPAVGARVRDPALPGSAVPGPAARAPAVREPAVPEPAKPAAPPAEESAPVAAAAAPDAPPAPTPAHQPSPAQSAPVRPTSREPAPARPAPAQPGPAAPVPAPSAPAHRPVVRVTGDASFARPLNVVERALRASPGGGASRDPVVVVRGGHRPGKPDQLQRDQARVRLPLRTAARIVVLGCTGGAGQTVTTLLTGQLLASLRDEAVAVVDLGSGETTLTEQARLIPVLMPRRRVAADSAAAAAVTERGLQVVTARESSDDPDQIVRAVAERYPLTLADPDAGRVPKTLRAADQLILVAPATTDAPTSLAMTLEWLEAHDHRALAAGAITVLNGVSPATAGHAERAAAVASGRSRAILQVPWDEHVHARQPLGAATIHAYTALAGILVAALAEPAHAPAGAIR